MSMDRTETFDPKVCVCSLQDDTGTVECPKSCLVRWSASRD